MLSGFLGKSFDMSKFASTYPDKEFVQQVVAQIPWGHNVVILDKIDSVDERIWYLKNTVANGWSRNVLVHQIESNLYQRQVLANKVSIKLNDMKCQSAH